MISAVAGGIFANGEIFAGGINGGGFASFATLSNSLGWNDLAQIFSPYLIAAGVGYLVAELIKIAIILAKNRRFRWREIFKSGGMPSSHTSTVVALATVIGLEKGFGSAIFALAAIFAVIVMTDATHVRRAVGEQGETLRRLIERDHKQEGAITDIARETGAGDSKTRAQLPKPYLARGHKPLEMLIGALIGVAVGLATVIIMM